MYKICYYVPESHVQTTKEAMFQAGAGRYKNYACCAFEVKGQGQFMPLEGSAPYIGQKGEVTYTEEYRVEMLCEDHLIMQVIEALRLSHPYEVPAYDVWPLTYCGV